MALRILRGAGWLASQPAVREDLQSGVGVCSGAPKQILYLAACFDFIGFSASP